MWVQDDLPGVRKSKAKPLYASVICESVVKALVIPNIALKQFFLKER